MSIKLVVDTIRHCHYFIIFVGLFLFVRDVCAFELLTDQSVAHACELHIVFAGIHYPDKQLFLNDMAMLKNGLWQTKPFDEFRSKIDFSYVVLSQKEEQQYFKATGTWPPLSLGMGLINRIAVHKGRVFKLVVIDYNDVSSCAELSSIRKFSVVVISRVPGKWFVNVFLHELGHSLGLRDECVHCRSTDPGSPNCAPDKETARQWWGSLVSDQPYVDYIEGCCGHLEYIRPTIASLMNDVRKASDFGPVNEAFLMDVLSGLK
ncbi:MAG: hypothetical protein V2A70_07425 [Candidatus Omnitrophota bacterium]